VGGDKRSWSPRRPVSDAPGIAFGQRAGVLLACACLARIVGLLEDVSNPDASPGWVCRNFRPGQCRSGSRPGALHHSRIRLLRGTGDGGRKARLVRLDRIGPDRDIVAPDPGDADPGRNARKLSPTKGATEMARPQHAVQPPDPAPADWGRVVGFATERATTWPAEADVVVLGAGGWGAVLRSELASF